MVATVGSISIDLSTNAAKFAQGFKQNAQTVEQYSGRMAKSLSAVEKASSTTALALKGFVGGIVAGAGLTSLSSIIDRTREAIGHLDDVASKARTSGLGTDLFQALSLAAKKANIDVESLSGGLEIFAKNTALAAHGNGALFSALKDLNPELLKNILKGKDQESRLKTIADAFDRTKDATQRAALATALFGRSGVDFERLFDGGAKAIDGFVEAARKLGVLIPQETLDKASQLDDQLDDLSETINSNLDQALVNAGPILVALSGKLADFTKSANDLTTSLTNLGNVDLGKALNAINDLIPDSLKPGLGIPEAVAPAISSITDMVSGTAGDFADLQKQIAAVKQEIDDTTKGLKELNDAGVPFEDTRLPRENLKALQAQLETLQDKAAHLIVDLDTSAAKAKIADLAQAFRAAENASMQALSQLQTSNFPTVTRGNTSPGTQTINPDTLQLTTTPGGLKQINVEDYLKRGYASGGFTGHTPADQVAGFVHGGEYVMDAATTRKIGVGNLDAMRRGVSGYADGGLVGVGGGIGASLLDDIESNTHETLNELKSHTEYLKTIEDDIRAQLAPLKAIESGIDDWSKMSRSSGGSSSTGSSGGSGGYSGGGGGGSTSYASNDARSPYYYGGIHYPGGAQYNPVADYLYNGNVGALGQIAGSPYGPYEATPTTNPFDVNRNHFQTNLDIANMLKAAGPQLGTYGGGTHITAPSEFTTAESAGKGFFSGGYRFDTAGLNKSVDASQLVADTPGSHPPVSNTVNLGGVSFTVQGSIDRQSQLAMSDLVVRQVQSALAQV